MLSLMGTHVGDAGLRNLSCLADLRELDLAITRVSDTGLTWLTLLDNRKIVRVGNTAITQSAIDQLSKRYPRLEIREQFLREKL